MTEKITSPVILYLIGLAGTGKLTIAQAVEPLGFKIIDNHLINDPIFKTLDLEKGTPIPKEAWAAIYQIRDIVQTYITTNPIKSFIFTSELLEGSEEDKELCKRLSSCLKRGVPLLSLCGISFLMRRELVAL